MNNLRAGNNTCKTEAEVKIIGRIETHIIEIHQCWRERGNWNSATGNIVVRCQYKENAKCFTPFHYRTGMSKYIQSYVVMSV